MMKKTGIMVKQTRYFYGSPQEEKRHSYYGVFASQEEAQAWIEQQEQGVYETTAGESGRPTYKAVRRPLHRFYHEV